MRHEREAGSSRDAGRVRRGIGTNSGCDAELNDLRPQVSVRINRQYTDGDGQFEAAWAAGPGIEIKHALLSVEIWHVRVAMEDCGKLPGSRVEVQGLQVVEHIEVDARLRRVLDEDDIGFGELAAGALGIYVAPDCRHWRDRFKFGKNGNLSHIAQMQNAFNALECWSDLGAEQTVSVADNADLHGFRIAGLAARVQDCL